MNPATHKAGGNGLERLWLWIALLILMSIHFGGEVIFRWHVWDVPPSQDTIAWFELCKDSVIWIIVTFLIILQVRKRRELQRANHELQNARRELESRVKERTEELRKANLWLAHILSSNPASIYAAKPCHPYDFTFISDSIRSQTGYEPRDFTKDPYFRSAHVHPQDEPKVVEHLENLFQKGSGVIEYRFLGKDGAYRWMRDEINLIRDKAGEPVEIIGAWFDITDRKKSEEALLSSEMRFQAFMDYSPILAFLKDDQGRHIYGNKNWKGLFSLSDEDFFGKKASELFSVELAERFDEADKAVVEAGKMVERTEAVLDPDGMVRYYLAFKFPLRDAVGQTYLGCVALDITDRHRMEKELQASVNQKALLLREIHHRVKNNLQVINSMLELQSRFSDGKPTAEILRDAERRVNAMALVHEKLYQSENLAGIGISEYLQSLVGDVYGFYRLGESGAIKVSTEVSGASFGIDTAIPLGLIVSELVSNCLKHAFPGGRKGEVKITLCPVGEDEFELRVADDGIGLPESVGFESRETLGLQLVGSLAAQIRGEISVLRDRGSEFRLRFKGTKVRRRGMENDATSDHDCGG
ncbi:MAG: PAS domain S-box protein [Desulfomonile tiedjei]|nr:PAS domain S-box protein [Desulfomonile tiedjei]